MIERLSTYVKGLDDLLNGGIPRNHVVLVAGRPGTMKSSLVYSTLAYNALNHSIPSIYVTLEQGANSLQASMKSFGLPVEEVKGLMTILDIGLVRKRLTQTKEGAWLETFKSFVEKIRRERKSELIAIDSLPVLEVMSKFRDPREDLFYFFEWLKELNLTAFLVHELKHGQDQFCRYDEDFLADGIIHLDMKRFENIVNVYIGVLKMRQTNHNRCYFPLVFSKDYFEIVTT